MTIGQTSLWPQLMIGEHGVCSPRSWLPIPTSHLHRFYGKPRMELLCFWLPKAVFGVKT